MIDVVASLPAEARAKAKKRAMPRWVTPMAATLTDERFSDPRWLFEAKFDGERCVAYRSARSIRLSSRNRLVLNDHYPELVKAFANQPAMQFIVDGEVVAFAGGRTSFARLQRRMGRTDANAARETGVAVCFYAFDLVYANGYDLTRVPLRFRKAALRKLLAFNSRLRYTAHRNGEGEAAWSDACANHLEGIIAKNGDSTYQQRRSRDWLKFKCVNEQEFVIGGFTEPAGARARFGALLLGYHDDGKLVYAGKVGTGFDAATLDALGSRLRARERLRSPFGRGTPQRTRVHWVKPDLVAQIGFTEWTQDGQLRHPRFLGVRRDKSARDVKRERDSLKTYQAKRRFARTPEPRGGARSRRKPGSRFVVQRHAARSLHYDLRLEVNGVLRSWAVPKGLPERAGDKRLAMQTEDHPLEYVSFEGTIPTGEYGAGTIEIWDRGTFRNLTRRDEEQIPVDEALADGQLTFRLEGKKTRGDFLLKRTGASGRKWLVIRVHGSRPPR